MALPLVLHAAEVDGQTAATSVALVPAAGPDGGQIDDLTIHPSTGRVVALSATGLYGFEDDSRAWSPLVVRAVSDPASPAIPGWPPPAPRSSGPSPQLRPRSLWMAGRDAITLTPRGELWRAALPDGLWTAADPDQEPTPAESSTGPTELTTNAEGATWLLCAMAAGGPDGASRSSRLYRRSPDGTGWTSSDVPGRASLVSMANGHRGASWRRTTALEPMGAGRWTTRIDRFVYPDEALRTELDWAGILKRSARLHEGCAGAEAMLWTRTSSGEGEPPALVAVGPQSVCVSTDGGTYFTVRPGPWVRPAPGRVLGAIAIAAAFPLQEAQAGFRVLIGTAPAVDLQAEPGRVFGGRLFMSDSAGERWQEVTPDIEGPGAFVDLEARLSDGGTAQVWLLTARRGVYASARGGHGFVRTSTGLNAQSIFALFMDVYREESMWAASPTGLYKYDGGWTREVLAQVMSFGVARDSHQMWAGTTTGHLLHRPDDGGFEHELIGERPGAPDGALDDEAAATRVVVAVVPTGRNEMGEVGYAAIDGEGIWRREASGQWSLLPPPPTPNREPALAVAAPTESGADGLLMFVRGGEPASIAEAWRYTELEGWAGVALPDGLAPSAALWHAGSLWLASRTGGVYQGLVLKGRFEATAIWRRDIACAALAPSGRAQVLCGRGEGVADGADGVDGAVSLGSVLRYPLEDSEAPETVALTAINPRGRQFGPPVALAATVNEIGEQLWVTPGLGVYTTPQALEPLLPAEEEESALSWVPWVQLGLGLALAGFLVIGILIIRREILRTRVET